MKNLKCELPELSKSTLIFYFRKKLLELTGISYNYHYIRSNGTSLIIYFRCNKTFKLKCKSRFMIIFDKKNKLANIYQNDDIHNHNAYKRLNQNQIRKHRMDVIYFILRFFC